MRNSVLAYFEGMFILFVAFSYSAFFISINAFGINKGKYIYILFNIAITIIAILLFLNRYKYMPPHKNTVIMTICFIIVGFLVSLFWYGTEKATFIVFFLSMGVRVVPALLMGVYMHTDKNILNKVEKALFPFMILYTFSLAKAVFFVSINRLGTNLLVYNSSEGMTYQNISYYSAYAFCMSLYLFYGEEKYLLENAVKKIKKLFGELILGINYIQINDDYRFSFLLPYLSYLFQHTYLLK